MARMKKARNILLCIVLCAVSLLCACAPSLQVSAAPEQIISPAEPIVVEQKDPVNPVAVFFGGFMGALGYHTNNFDQTDTSSPHSLELDMYVQRLQHFFLPPAQLPLTDELIFDGIMAGALSGSGTLTGDENACRFTSQFHDGTRVNGAIEGGLMQAQWKYSETTELESETYLNQDGESIELAPRTQTIWHTFRSAEILRGDELYISTLNWDGENALILITTGGIYFCPGEYTAVEFDKTNIDIIKDNATWVYTEGDFIEQILQDEEQENEG